MIYVTSDLHGCSLQLLLNLLEKANFNEKDRLYILGDVIDRGNNGLTLLEWIMNTVNVSVILGNHEYMMLYCKPLFEYSLKSVDLDRQNRLLSDTRLWIQNGGMETIKVLTRKKRLEVQKIFSFLSRIPLYETICVEKQEIILTHSGLDNFDRNKSLTDYLPEDLLWNRPQITDKYFDDKTIVFGHTPTSVLNSHCTGKALITKTWIDVDTGSGMGGTPMLLRLNDMKEYYI